MSEATVENQGNTTTENGAFKKGAKATGAFVRDFSGCVAYGAVLGIGMGALIGVASWAANATMAIMQD